MNIVPPRFKLFPVTNAMIRKASLPNRKLRAETVRESAFDQPDRSLQRDLSRSEEKVDMIRHDDERMQLVMAQPAVVLQCFDEHFCVGWNLE